MNESAIWKHGKPTTGYRNFGRSLEPVAVPDPRETTPVDEFFVCNAGHAPDLDRSEWSMRVSGAVAVAVELTLADVMSLPQHDLTSWLECAGNGRRLFAEAAGHEMLDEHMQTPWMLNAMGQATWRGPRLRDVLAIAEIHADARWVAPRGLDIDNAEGETPQMCLPIDKALDNDTIIALEMNGAPLARSHGAPARLLVPGWIGAYSMKWLGEIVVSGDWMSSWRSDGYYVLRDPDGEATGPATTHPVKSNLALPFPAELSAGNHRISGFARSGFASIELVEWRVNAGAWHETAMEAPADRWSWTPFTIDVDLDAGDHVIETRATDEAGNTQPQVQPIHRNGVLWHAITPHPITVR